MFTSDDADAILAKLAEQGLSLACDLHGRALAAEDAADAAQLAAAWRHTARSVRQTLALAARLERDRTRAARDDQAAAERDQAQRSDTRKAQVRATVERLVLTETEGEKAEKLLADLDLFLDEDALYDRLADQPAEAHVARLCEELGLPTPPPPEGSEGASIAASPPPRLSGPPQSLRDSSASGGASPDHPFHSSA